MTTTTLTARAVRTAPDRNITTFYFLNSVSAMAFISGNWIFFWLRVMTYGELGLFDALLFTYGLLAEIPTGALSDLLGKKRTLIIATALNALGWTFMGMGDTIGQLAFGFFLTNTGWAFFSGAAEALAYDSLKERGQEARFERVIANSHMIGIITFSVSVLVGGVMYNLHFRLPHLAWGIAFLLAMFTTLLLREPKIDSQKFSLRGYARQFARGFTQLRQPALRPYLLLMFSGAGAYFLFSYGLISPAMATGFGFQADAQAVIGAILGVLGALAAGFVPRLRRLITDRQGLVLVVVLLIIGFAGAVFPLGAVGFFMLLVIRIAGALVHPWLSVIVNREIPSADRATTLSTVAMLSKIPYALTAVIAGVMAEAGSFTVFSGMVALVLLLVLGFSLWRGRTAVLAATMEKSAADIG